MKFGTFVGLIVKLFAAQPTQSRTRHRRSVVKRPSLPESEEEASLRRWAIQNDLEEARDKERWLNSLKEIPAPGLGGTELLIQFSRNGPANFRKVRADSIKHGGGYIYLDGYCFRNQERRTFGVDGIRCVADPETNEEWPTLQSWLDAKGIAVDWSVAEGDGD